MEETYVSIALSEIAYLWERDSFLTCLENAGVDNWVGYAQSQKEFEMLESIEDQFGEE